MKQPKIIVAGIGPGSKQNNTPAVISAVQEADVVARYGNPEAYNASPLSPKIPNN